MSRTSSLWGAPPGRIYRFVNFCLATMGVESTVCIVGCSDGKFVFPFLRKGFHVTGIEVDQVAIYGGKKLGPCTSVDLRPAKYISGLIRPDYQYLPSREYSCMGIIKRVDREGYSSRFKLHEMDFYHNDLGECYNIVVTSCSMQYKYNRDLSLAQTVERLQNIVYPRGYLYMDYMMPLEEEHEWKSDVFARKGKVGCIFKDGWEILYNREMNNPVWEAPHIERPCGHFHRFGYILAKKRG